MLKIVVYSGLSCVTNTLTVVVNRENPESESKQSLTPDFNFCKFPPYAHQFEDIQLLLDNPKFALWNDMGTGKSKEIVDTACFLFQHNALDVVVIVSPAAVKGVWNHPKFGEIVQHAFHPVITEDYDSRMEKKILEKIDHGEKINQSLNCFIVTSYEFLRQQDSSQAYPKVDLLLKMLKGRRWWLVCDESHALSNHKSNTTRALVRAVKRGRPERRTLLNGTPGGNSPLGLYGQFSVLGKELLGYNSFSQFKAAYAVEQMSMTGGHEHKQITGYQNLDELAARTKPYCVRRDKSLLDLPEMMPPSFYPVTLDKDTWKAYKDVQRDLMTEWGDGRLVVNYATTKYLRLAQVCCGFVTGVESTDLWAVQTPLKWFGYEKLKAFLDWYVDRLNEDSKFKCVVWCRFRPQLELLIERLKSLQFLAHRLPKFEITWKYGGNVHHLEYLDAKNMDAPHGAVIHVGQPQAGKFGDNLARSATNVWLSSDYDLVTFDQAQARSHRQGLKTPLNTIIFTGVGPDGQPTIEEDIFESLRDKRSVATRLESDWKRLLEER